MRIRKQQVDSAEEKGFGLEPDAVIVVRAEDIDPNLIAAKQNHAECFSEFIVAKQRC